MVGPSPEPVTEISVQSGNNAVCTPTCWHRALQKSPTWERASVQMCVPESFTGFEPEIAPC